jgi:AraC-like DNA-binding protein
MMIQIEITSFEGNKLIKTISEYIAKNFSIAQHADDFISFELPFGKIKFSTLNSGLSIGLVDMNANFPGLLINFHGTNSRVPYKIGFCQKGNFQLNYRNENFTKSIQGGTNFIITPRPDSSLIALKHIQTSFLYIFISPEFLDNYFNISDNELKIHLRKESQVDFLFMHGTNTAQINLALSELFNDNYSGNLSRLMLESKTLELLTLFFHQFVISKNSFSSKEKDTFLDIHQFIEKNLYTTITVKQLSIHSGLNEHKLQKGFKIIFGSTVQKHIKKLRMQKARQLIHYGNSNVSEAAFSVGYSNLSHFASAFKQVFGVLPNEMKQ